MSEYEYTYNKWVKGNNRPLQHLGEDELHNLFVLSLERSEMLINKSGLGNRLSGLWKTAIEKNYTVEEAYERIIELIEVLHGT